jgi:hypothetical protein
MAPHRVKSSGGFVLQISRFRLRVVAPGCAAVDGNAQDRSTALAGGKPRRLNGISD